MMRPGLGNAAVAYALEVVGNEVVVLTLVEKVNQARPLVRVAECPALDLLQREPELRRDREAAVDMVVSDARDVCGEVAKEEDILLSDL